MAENMSSTEDEMSGDEEPVMKKENKAGNAYTEKATQVSVKAFRKYLQQNYLPFDFENFSAEQLDDILCVYYKGAQNQNGTPCKKSTLITIRHGLNRYLQKFDLIRGQQFQKSNVVFKARIKELKKQGLGVHTNPALTRSDLKKLYMSFNINDPASLQSKVFVDMLLYFKCTGKQKLRDLKMSDFVCKTDIDTGLRYICLEKESNCSNHAVMYEKRGNSRLCPVTSFLLYKTMMPPGCDFLFPQVSRKPLLSFYDKVAIGHNRLGNMTSILSKEAHLSRVYTNQSLRATPAWMLDDLDIPDETPSFTTELRVSGPYVSHLTERPKMSNQSEMVQKRVTRSATSLRLSEVSSIDVGYDDSAMGCSMIKQEEEELEVLKTDSPPALSNRIEEDTVRSASVLPTAMCVLCGFSADNKALFDKSGNATVEYGLVNKLFGPKLDFSMGTSICHVCEMSLKRLGEIDTELQNLEQRLWERMQITSLEGSTRFNNLFTKFLQKRNRRMCNQLVTFGMEGYFVYIHGENNDRITFTGTPLAEKFLKECPNEMDRFRSYCRSGDVNHSGSCLVSNNTEAASSTQQHRRSQSMHSIVDNSTTTRSVQSIPVQIQNSVQGNLGVSQPVRFPVLVNYSQPSLGGSSRPQLLLAPLLKSSQNVCPSLQNRKPVTVQVNLPRTGIVQQCTKSIMPVSNTKSNMSSTNTNSNLPSTNNKSSMPSTNTNSITPSGNGKQKGRASQALSALLAKRAKSKSEDDIHSDSNSTDLSGASRAIEQHTSSSEPIRDDNCHIDNVPLDPNIIVKTESEALLEQNGDVELDISNLISVDRISDKNLVGCSAVSSATGQMFIVQDGQLMSHESTATLSDKLTTDRSKTISLGQNPVPVMLIDNVHKDDMNLN